MAKDLFYRKSTFIFDAFGTLFKTIPLEDSLERIIGRSTSELLLIWRKKQLEYSWLRNQMNAYVPFNEVTKEALDYAMRKVSVVDERIAELLLPVYDQPTLINSADALLKTLKTKGKQTAILSNGTPQMLKNGATRTGIHKDLDALLSVDQIRKYKPSPEVYQMALNQLDVKKEDALFFSSNQWDVSGASTFGLDAIWVNQYNETKESLPFGQVIEVDSLNAVIQYFE